MTSHVFLASAAIKFLRTQSIKCSNGCIRGKRYVTNASSNRGTDELSRSLCWIRRCKSEKEVESLGKQLAKVCESGSVIMLRGDLGAGKTTLARGLIREKLQEPELRVTSPSYLLDNVYEYGNLTIHHIDLYRLPTGSDMSIIGIPHIFKSALCLIEWPQRISAQFMPIDYIDIELLFECDRNGEENRIVKIKPSSSTSVLVDVLKVALGTYELD